MKGNIRSTNLLQVAILILLTSNLLFMATQTVSAIQTRAKPSNSDVLKWANQAADRRQWTEAAAWYAIYIDREPPIPRSDQTYWNKLTRQLDSMKGNAFKDQDLAGDTRTNQDFINNCFRDNDIPIPQTFTAQSLPPAPLTMIQMGPAPDEIWVFQDFDFKGPWNVLTIGNYIKAGQFGMPDNSISSVMVGSKVRTYLCTDEGLNGTCGMFDSHVPFHHPNLTNNVTGNDSISSIRVEPETNKCTPGPNEVTLFMHFDYKFPCQTLSFGDYQNSSEFKLPDNGVSSIQVGSNVQAYLCPNENFGGNCETITYNDPNLSDNTIGNDQLSSIRITTR
jgi:hypothetical protein